MRYTRQNRILELITNQNIETQTQLAEILNNEGYNVTQATISRDIKNLMLVKQPKNGKSCYVLPEKSDNAGKKLHELMKGTVLSVDIAENIIVIKTLNGCCGPVAEAIDLQKDPAILGTIAGENTIIAIVKSKDVAADAAQKLREALK